MYIFLKKVTFFLKMLGVTVVKSHVTHGSWLIARCFRFIFVLGHADSTCSKFRVSAYSRINTVYHVQNFCREKLQEMW